MTAIDTATDREVRELLLANGWTDSGIRLADEEYAIPTAQAIADFGRRFGAFLFNSRLDDWVAEVWDCDNFALTAKSFADIDNALWRRMTRNDFALGFGFIWVDMPSGNGHAINVALARDAGALALRYYEPQMQPSTKALEPPNVWLQEKPRAYFTSPLFCYF